MGSSRNLFGLQGTIGGRWSTVFSFVFPELMERSSVCFSSCVSPVEFLSLNAVTLNALEMGSLANWGNKLSLSCLRTVQELINLW